MTTPIGYESIEILFNIMDYPLVFSLIFVFPIMLILFFAYSYKKRKKERLLLVEKLGIEKNDDVLLWIIIGKDKPDYLN